MEWGLGKGAGAQWLTKKKLRQSGLTLSPLDFPLKACAHSAVGGNMGLNGAHLDWINGKLLPGLRHHYPSSP